MSRTTGYIKLYSGAEFIPLGDYRWMVSVRELCVVVLLYSSRHKSVVYSAWLSNWPNKIYYSWTFFNWNHSSPRNGMPRFILLFFRSLSFEFYELLDVFIKLQYKRCWDVCSTPVNGNTRWERKAEYIVVEIHRERERKNNCKLLWKCGWQTENGVRPEV